MNDIKFAVPGMSIGERVMYWVFDSYEGAEQFVLENESAVMICEIKVVARAERRTVITKVTA